MSVRDSVARRLTGGPPFRVVPDQMLVDLEVGGRVQDGTETIRDSEVVNRVETQLQDIGFEVQRLEEFGVLKV